MNENKARSRLDQRRAPIYEALERFRQMRVVPFDVPGHKRGRGNPELTAFLGQQCVGVDVNSMKPLDNLCHPVSVIREAEELAADAFGAAHAFLMVGGTTSSVQSMVLTACKRGDEIILPRNVHRSVLNALVLCGAVPVYVNPEVDKRLGISLGMKREQVAKAIKEHPNAVAVLVNNPTYYGICSDLRAIVKMAHDAGMLCLADEAHGTHFYFGGGLPVSAMAAGADMASVSMHKSGGSLTQSSLLLIGPNVHQGYVRQIINLTQTTSGSYLLMSSLDISRRNLALRGRQVFHQVADIAEYAREEINAVGGYYAFGKELCNGDSVFDFDTTKLSVHTLDIGLAGIEELNGVGGGPGGDHGHPDAAAGQLVHHVAEVTGAGLFPGGADAGGAHQAGVLHQQVVELQNGDLVGQTVPLLDVKGHVGHQSRALDNLQEALHHAVQLQRRTEPAGKHLPVANE